MASVIRGSGTSSLGGDLDIEGVLTYEDVSSVDSVGVITARSGINVGTGTSISSPSDNVLTLGTNNGERLRITSSGGVSICKNGTFNTTAGNETLYIQGEGHNGHGTSNTLSVFSVVGAIASNTNAAGLWVGTRTDENTAVIGTRTASGNLAIETYNSGSWGERLRILSNGYVGIGTDDPQSMLHVGARIGGGQLRVSSQVNPDGITITSRNDGNGSQVNARGTNSHLRFYTTNSSDTNSEKMRLDGVGRLLVGSETSVNSAYEKGSIHLKSDAGGVICLKRNDGTSTNDVGILEFHSSFGRSALITVNNDGTHSGSSTPGAITFQTTPSGTFNTPTEALRIHSTSDVTFERRMCTATVSGNTGSTRTLTLNNVDEGAAYLVTLTRSGSLSSVSIYQTLIRYDGNGAFEGNDDIVNSTPGNMTITYGDASGGTATLTFVNGGTQRFRVTALRVN